MNTRRRKRKKKKTLKIFTVVMLLIVLTVVGAAAWYARGDKDTQNSSDEKTETQELEISVKKTEEELRKEAIEEVLSKMTLEDKVAQLFVVVPESLMDVGTVVAAGDATQRAINETPVGGFIYMSANLVSPDQTKEMLENVQKYSIERTGLPAFVCVDEEGGTVARVGNNSAFGVISVGDMADIGASGDAKKAFDAGNQIGAYLSELGFNVDFAPVADVLTNSENTVVRDRSFGNDAVVVSDMAEAVSDGLMENNVYSVYKHFPGHGSTSGDTHAGYAASMRTMDELKACDLVPFERAVEADVEFIMAGHISFPNIIGDVPASLSKELLTDLLRNEMGYEGIIITDALNMGAVTQHYSSGEAAVLALEAGVDLLLMPENFREAYNGVLEAVESGRISQERVNESLARILSVKLDMAKE